MSRRFRGKTCVYCCSRDAESDDHVFARQFFPKDKRSDMPKVPACEACNNLKSQLESYLATVLPFGAEHADAIANLESMVPKRLDGNQRLRRQVTADLEIALAGTESEQLPGLSFDGGKFHEWAGMVVRGLLFHHWGVLLSPGHGVCVTSPRPQLEQAIMRMFGAKVGQRASENLGDGSFIYQGAQGVADPEFSLWVIRIYGGLKVASVTEGGREETGSLIAFTADQLFVDRHVAQGWTRC